MTNSRPAAMIQHFITDFTYTYIGNVIPESITGYT